MSEPGLVYAVTTDAPMASEHEQARAHPWRFRTNWRGHLILQRYESWPDHEAQHGERCQWRDATSMDLHAYYTQVVQ